MTFYFVPFLVMAGRLAFRVVMNTWNMIESSAYHLNPMGPGS